MRHPSIISKKLWMRYPSIISLELSMGIPGIMDERELSMGRAGRDLKSKAHIHNNPGITDAALSQEIRDEAPIYYIPEIVDGKGRALSTIQGELWMRRPSIIYRKLLIGMDRHRRLSKIQGTLWMGRGSHYIYDSQ